MGGAGRVFGWFVQGWGAGVAVPAFAPDCEQHAVSGSAVVWGSELDGKAASEWVGGPNPERALVAAASHGGGLTLGRTTSDGAGGGIPVA